MQQYNVIFDGEVLPGQHLDKVKQKIAMAMKVDPLRVDSWIQRGGKALKRHLTLEQGKAYICAMAKLGAMAYLVPAEDPADDKVQPQTSQPADNASFTDTGSFSVQELTSELDGESDPVEESEDEVDEHNDTTVPADIVGAMSSGAFASYFEQQEQTKADNEREVTGAHEIFIDDDTTPEDVVTDNKKVIDMRKLATMVKSKID